MIIKTFYIILLLCLNIRTVSAQETTHGGFASPVIKITSINSKSAVIGGIRAGWVIAGRYVIGGSYYGVLNNVQGPYIDPVTLEQYNIEFTTGGLDLEYIAFYNSDFNVSSQIYLGGGGVKYISLIKENQYNTVGGTNLLVWEPQLNLNYKINNWLRISSAVGYRFISHYKEYLNLKQKDLEGLSINISVRFGSYK